MVWLVVLAALLVGMPLLSWLMHRAPSQVEEEWMRAFEPEEWSRW
jgi:hypothetical protein